MSDVASMCNVYAAQCRQWPALWLYDYQHNQLKWEDIKRMDVEPHKQLRPYPFNEDAPPSQEDMLRADIDSARERNRV